MAMNAAFSNMCVRRVLAAKAGVLAAAMAAAVAQW
jgi:hypothetical protein